MLKTSKERKQSAQQIYPSSIIVPFRNEYHRIEGLLNSFSKAKLPDYKCFEILFIDDHSEDNTSEKILEFINNYPKISVKLISLTESQGKKAALIKGVELSQYSKIICLDADIKFTPDWLINSLKFSVQHQFVIGAVWFDKGTSILQKFDFYENALLQWFTRITAANNTPLLANGAYMSFSKTFFQESKVFHESIETASGDDIFLLEGAKRMAHTFIYTGDFNHAVYTHSSMVFRQFISQKIRWARKSFLIKNASTYTFGIAFLVKQVLFLYAIFSLNIYLTTVAFMLIMAEMSLLKTALHFRKVSVNPLSAFFFLTMYHFYSIAIALLAMLNVPLTWKSRKIKA